MRLITSRTVWYTIGGVLNLEILSLLGYAFPGMESWFWILAVLFSFVVSLKSLRSGVGIALVELVIGSKGHLLDLTLFGPDISLRMGIFSALLIAAGIHAVRTRKVTFTIARTGQIFFPLFFVVGIGLAIGFLHGTPLGLIYLDANALLYFFLIIPFYQGLKTLLDVRHVLSMALGGIVALLIKTGILLLAFSHGIPFLTDIYRWVRVTGVGEITALNDSYRFFFQSYIYLLFFLVFLFVCKMVTVRKHQSFPAFLPTLLLSGGAIAGVILSGSRSLWLATTITGIAFVLIFSSWRHTSWTTWRRILSFAILSLASGIAWIAVITQIPIPRLETLEFSTTSLISERTTDTGTDEASSSRFALLGPLTSAALEHPLFGSGFGATVTYKTDDPRFLETHPDGLNQTYAFEWGYLDIFYKTGIIGLIGWGILGIGVLTYTVLLIKMDRKPSRRIILYGIGLTTIALFSIHLTTPYLNHPLGIGWLLMSGATLEVISREHA